MDVKLSIPFIMVVDNVGNNDTDSNHSVSGTRRSLSASDTEGSYLAVSVKHSNNTTPSNLFSLSPVVHSTGSSTLSLNYYRMGRPSEATQLAAHRSNSLGQIPDFFKRATLKRQRDDDSKTPLLDGKSSPLNKICRSYSSPPKINSDSAFDTRGTLDTANKMGDEGRHSS